MTFVLSRVLLCFFTAMYHSYVFLVHGKGPAVGDFGNELSLNSTTTSSQIRILNNNIQSINCWTNEVPGKSNLQLLS
jgi:hypothetical protein